MKPSAKIKEVVANRIVLRSPKGQTRAWFDASSEGTVSLNLFGPQASISIGIDSDGNPKIHLQNKRNRVAIAMGVSDELGHAITLHDAEGKPVCFIAVPNNGLPHIELFQAVSATKGKRIWKTPRRKGRRKRVDPA